LPLQDHQQVEIQLDKRQLGQKQLGLASGWAAAKTLRCRAENTGLSWYRL
jgi:hypothetical protein